MSDALHSVDENKNLNQQYLDALLEYPEFQLPNDTIDHLLPSAKVQSWSVLLETFQNDDFIKTQNDLVFRGHAGHNWELSSTLGRLFDNGDIPEQKREHLLKQFKLSMRGRGYDLIPLEDDNEIWAVGQHHGLRTPLLDWTRSPFVALFFAFEKYQTQEEIDRNPSRVIFCMNKTKIEEDIGKEFVQALFLEPEDHRNSRLVNQSGLFTIDPSGQENFVSQIIKFLDQEELLSSATVEPQQKPQDGFDFFAGAREAIAHRTNDRKRAKLLARYLFKLHIPNSMEERRRCLEALRQMNIHHGSLFPDPVGASQFCNDWFQRLLADEDREREEVKKSEEKQIIDKALQPKPTQNVDGDVQDILEVYYGSKGDEIKELTTTLSRNVLAASTLDWANFPSKVVRVKKSISRTLIELPFELQAGYKFDELVKVLLEKFKSAAARDA